MNAYTPIPPTGAPAPGTSPSPMPPAAPAYPSWYSVPGYQPAPQPAPQWYPAPGFQPTGPAPGTVPGPAVPGGAYAPPYAPYTPAQVPPGGYPNYPVPGFALRPQDNRKKPARRTLNRTAAIILAQVAVNLVLQLVFLQICLMAQIDIQNDSLCLSLMTAALSPICTTGPAIVYMFIYRCDWGSFLGFEKTGFGAGLLWVFAGLGLCIAGNYPAIIVENLLEMAGASSPPSVVGQGGSWIDFSVELVGVAILVPIMEELAFRGVIFSSLQKYGTGFAIVGSALIFGMAHLNLSSVIFATIAGLGMAIAYAKTHNLWVTVCIHAANNGLSVLGSYAHLLPMDEASQELFLSILSVVPLILGTIAFIILMAIGHRKKRNAEPKPAPAIAPLRGGEIVACLLSSVLLWAVFAMVLMETAMLFVI